MSIRDLRSLAKVSLRPHGTKIGEVKASARLIFPLQIKGTAWHDMIQVPLASIVLHAHAWFEHELDVADEFLEAASKQCFGMIWLQCPSQQLANAPPNVRFDPISWILVSSATTFALSFPHPLSIYSMPSAVLRRNL